MANTNGSTKLKLSMGFVLLNQMSSVQCLNFPSLIIVHVLRMQKNLDIRGSYRSDSFKPGGPRGTNVTRSFCMNLSMEQVFHCQGHSFYFLQLLRVKK